MKSWLKKSHKIVGILQNYQGNANILKTIHDPNKKPLFFLKPTTSFIFNTENEKKSIVIPRGCTVYHEGSTK
jgi:2-keto-4-pentenoate hydratase/2-oxohepta-3-ene-1,7-dioic acid hydratase in catechol pathway